MFVGVLSGQLRVNVDSIHSCLCLTFDLVWLLVSSVAGQFGSIVTHGDYALHSCLGLTFDLVWLLGSSVAGQFGSTVTHGNYEWLF